MQVTLDLDSGTLARLKERAARRGVTPNRTYKGLKPPIDFLKIRR